MQIYKVNPDGVTVATKNLGVIRTYSQDNHLTVSMPKMPDGWAEVPEEFKNKILYFENETLTESRPEALNADKLAALKTAETVTDIKNEIVKLLEG